MHRTDIFHGVAEQKFPGAKPLKTGQHVDFLQMEQLLGLLLHRRYPHGSPSDEAMNHATPVRISRRRTSGAYIHFIM